MAADLEEIKKAITAVYNKMPHDDTEKLLSAMALAAFYCVPTTDADITSYDHKHFW